MNPVKESIRWLTEMGWTEKEAQNIAGALRGKTQPEFLQLDHIHNDGAEDRKKNPATKLFAKLKRIGWPKDRYQLLCANCNFGKFMNGGICPHQHREPCYA